MSIEIINAEIVEWAKNYTGEKFMACVCDPPYHLTSITERFGKPGSAPAKDEDGLFKRASAGFMGKSWDGGDIAFDPATWEAIGNLLLPGAFGMAFAATRNYHRMATAIEDAGFLIHPMIVWIQGQGFPKASNPQKLLKKRDDDRADQFEGYRYGAQALKPVVEPICVFQKPWEGNNQLDNILEYGTGVYDIDSSRIGVEVTSGSGKGFLDGKGFGTIGHGNKTESHNEAQGRWPSGLILQHTPDCKIIGFRDDNYQINRFKDGAKPWGDAVGAEFTEHEIEGKTPVYECHPSCPAYRLDLQTGELKSGKFEDHHKITSEWGYHGGERDERPMSNTIGDKGGASRFFYQASWNLDQVDPFFYCGKASKKEKNEGLNGLDDKLFAQSNQAKAELKRGKEQSGGSLELGVNKIKRVKNNHPTVKPIDLNKYLARLILPPTEYAPRRILIPFAGVASEMIGSFLAGWDEIVGVEMESEYVEIAEARIAHWCKARQEEMF